MVTFSQTLDNLKKNPFTKKFYSLSINTDTSKKLHNGSYTRGAVYG